MLLIILMCFTWVFFETTFEKGLVCSVLLEHCALSALPWRAGVLVPLQLPALVLSVLLSESSLLSASVLTLCWKAVMTGSYIYLRFFRSS